MRSGRLAMLAVILVALVAAPFAHTATADPDGQSKLRKLTKQATALNKVYRGTIESLEDTRLAAKKATDRARDLKAALAAAEVEVSQIAQTTYIQGPLDGTSLFSTPGEPYQVLGQAANLAYLAAERGSTLNRVKDMVADAQKAKKEADAKIDDLERDIRKMRSKRGEIEKLLAKYGIQQPGSANGLTGRMVSVRDEVMRNFPMFYGVGCLRVGDPGEHGKGRACDFMMSPGGSMASGANLDRGDKLAQWLISNGSRLGVMYIIWKQRYYDVRTGGGWDMMSDRGGVTANHWDHVHVSVF
ncbi:coiled-coil domain-containing protein [Nonomuraea sp. NPDC059194]|uniref:coiled-coil domain-containing protein n=1 Tax=Nonomuraea sp. NPDC059194 TaxID=3346764 RepID=UPI003686A32F